MTNSVGAGRRRDPDVDRRVLASALKVYGEEGWGGFSVETVAKLACVGKASIYLRWSTKEALLVAALKQVVGVVEVETGNVRADLVRLSTQLLDLYLGPGGRAAMRIAVEAESIPAVDNRWKALRESQVLAARGIVRRAITRGELPAETSVTLLLDLLCGATTMHVQATPAHLRLGSSAAVAQYAHQLVDFLLASVGVESVSRNQAI